MTSKRDEIDRTLLPRGRGDATDLMRHNADMLTNMFNPMLAANISLLNWNASYCRRMAQAYSQWFDFMGRRFEADAAFAEKLQDAKDTEKISKVYSKFFKSAAEDYQKEVSELTRLTARMADEATDTLQDISSRQSNNGAVLGE